MLKKKILFFTIFVDACKNLNRANLDRTNLEFQFPVGKIVGVVNFGNHHFSRYFTVKVFNFQVRGGGSKIFFVKTWIAKYIITSLLLLLRWLKTKNPKSNLTINLQTNCDWRQIKILLRFSDFQIEHGKFYQNHHESYGVSDQVQMKFDKFLVGLNK